MQQRIKELQAVLPKDSGMLIMSPANRQYLTGFVSSAGMVFITAQNSWFFTDFRYYEKAAATVNSCRVCQTERGLSDLLPLCAENHVKTILIETDWISLQSFQRIQNTLQGIEVAEDALLDETLARLRAIKSRQEIEKIKEAQRLTDETFSYIVQQIRPGMREIDIMLEMEFFMRRQGSEGVSFDFIVVSGQNSSLPHGVPTPKKVEPGDFITMDFGGVIDGYRSDMTRTVAVGFVSDEQRRVYEIVRNAKNTAISSIAPGKVCKDIDRIARDLIDHAGYKGCFGHGLGHSVGLEIHENPSFNTRCETVLKPGMVLTVEPGIYLEKQFGVRIEDMGVVTKDGFENFTKSTDTLLIL